MTISKEQVLYVANLARLELDEQAVVQYAEQIGNILEYVNQLNEVDTQDVPPTSHALSLTNAFREDEAAGHMDRERALANAPRQEDGAFIVPKVIE